MMFVGMTTAGGHAVMHGTPLFGTVGVSSFVVVTTGPAGVVTVARRPVVPGTVIGGLVGV